MNEAIAGETVEAVPPLLEPGRLQKRSLVVNDCAHSQRFRGQIRHRSNLSPVQARTCLRKPVELVLLRIVYRTQREKRLTTLLDLAGTSNPMPSELEVTQMEVLPP